MPAVSDRVNVTAAGCPAETGGHPAHGSSAGSFMTMKRTGIVRGALFRSASDRNQGAPLSFWTWSKTVRKWALFSGLPDISTHTFRHLRLTHLARAGWKLHELATYAGHSDLATTQIYIHLSGRDLAAKMAGTIETADLRMAKLIFSAEK